MLADLPVVHAANYYSTRTHKPRLIVLHTPQTAETSSAAEGVARYFATGGTYNNGWRRTADGIVIGSTHLVSDNDSAIRCVHDHETAFGAAGANHDGLHHEIAGRTPQTPAEWADPYSTDALHLAAPLDAEWCELHEIPPFRLNDSQLLAGQSGFVGHDQVSRVYHKSTHTDPGADFPWGRYMQLVRRALEPGLNVPPLPKEVDMATATPKIIVLGELDGDGNGWAEAKVRSEDVLAATLAINDPADAGYRPGSVAVSNRNGWAIVSVLDGEPHGRNYIVSVLARS